MPATFVTLQKNDVFKSGGAADHLVKIPSIDGIDGIIGSSNLAVYNQVSATINETLQFFLTFDDIIKYIHFGKGLGSVTVEGTLFCDCTGNVPGLSKISQAITSLRGQRVEIVIGSMTLQAVMTSTQVTVVGEPDTMATFVVNFTVVDHQL
jgi:hypothetical protein